MQRWIVVGYTMFHLTGFQKDCLFAIAVDGPRRIESIRQTLDRCYRSVSEERVESALSTALRTGYVEKTSDGTSARYSITERCERQLAGGLLTQVVEEGPKNGLVRVSNVVYHNLPPRVVVATRRWANALRYDAPPDPTQRMWIDPDRITRRMDVRAFSNRNDRGRVVSGEWDRVTTSFADHPIYWGLEERFANGVAWRETPYFRWCKLRLEGRGRAFGCTTESQLLTERCEFVDDLYTSIAENGYRTQDRTDVQYGHRRHDQSTEITANVGRDGELLLYDGHHRLAIAKLLDIETVPIELVVRHSEWQAVRNSVQASDTTPSDDRKPNRIDHPDLRTLGDT